MFCLYGLTVDSDLDLPGIARASGDPEVVIRHGSVPRELDGPTVQGACFQATPGRFLLTLDRIARYSVVDGRDVTIDRAPGAGDAEVRTFLLGTVLGAVLYQRGLVPFHASAVQSSFGAVCFAGRSGAGKSTLAAAMVRRGYPLLTDDVAPVAVAAKGIPMVSAGPPSVWLWGDAVSELGISADALVRMRPEIEKHAWAARAGQPTEPVPVAAFYHLDRHNESGIVLTPMHGMERVRTLSNEVYRPAVAKALTLPRTLFNATTALARHAHIVKIRRPGSPYLLDQLVDAVIADLEQSRSLPTGNIQ